MRRSSALALGAVSGLAYLHEMRVVHFDLKPDNLLLDGPLILPGEDGWGGGGGSVVAGTTPAAAGGSSNNTGGGASAATPTTAASVGAAFTPAGVAAAAPSAASSASPFVAASASSPATPAPAAVVLASSIKTPAVKVADFGLAKHRWSSSSVVPGKDFSFLLFLFFSTGKKNEKKNKNLPTSTFFFF